MTRSAKVALVDNGNMVDTLGFIEGKTARSKQAGAELSQAQCLA